MSSHELDIFTALYILHVLCALMRHRRFLVVILSSAAFRSKPRPVCSLLNICSNSDFQPHYLWMFVWLWEISVGLTCLRQINSWIVGSRMQSFALFSGGVVSGWGATMNFSGEWSKRLPFSPKARTLFSLFGWITLSLVTDALQFSYDQRHSSSGLKSSCRLLSFMTKLTGFVSG